MRHRQLPFLLFLTFLTLLGACTSSDGGGGNGGGGGGTQPLTLNFGTPAVLTAGAMGATAEILVVGDFDGDGDLDIAVANTSDNNIGVFLNGGTANFANQVPYPTDVGPLALGAGLFNADNSLDLVTGNGNNNASFLPNNGNGTFGGKTDVPLTNTPTGIAVADFDGDGDPDAAFPDAVSNLRVLINNGGLAFTNQANTSNGKLTTPKGAVTADFSGDGKPDVAIADTGGNRAVVWTNSGVAGALFPDTNINNTLTLPPGSMPQGIAAGDFNNDGKIDIVVPNPANNSKNVSVFLNQGGGNFSAGTTFPAGSDSFQAAVADFNKDNKQDVVVLDFLVGNIAVLLGNGDGTFQDQKLFPVGKDGANATITPRSVAVGDFNGDTLPDVVIASDLNKVISVLLNTSN